MKVIRLREVPDEGRKGYSIKRLFTHLLTENPKNVGLYQTTIPAGSTCPNHSHAHLQEILYFLTEAKVATDSEVYSFKPGDLMILDVGEYHEIVAEGKEVRLIAVKLPNIVEDKVEKPLRKTVSARS